MFPPSRSLIIDSSRESRLLLADLLMRNGVEAIGFPTVKAALPLIKQAMAGVVVIDSDTQSPSELSSLASALEETSSPVVVIGTNRSRHAWTTALSFVRKPYRYEDLLRRISASLGGGVGAPASESGSTGSAPSRAAA